jgi:hypothetical protein
MRSVAEPITFARAPRTVSAQALVSMRGIRKS